MKVGIYMGYKGVYTSACIATYCANGDFLRDLLLRVDVDLVVLDARELLLLAELLEDWRDDLARSTPCRPEVNDNDLAAVNLPSRHQ